MYNAWTIVSKYHYALSSMDDGDETVEYRYTGGWKKTEDRAFTQWIRPKYDVPIGSNTLITAINNIGGKTSFTFGAPHSYKIGQWVKVEGTTSYNGIQKIIAMGNPQFGKTAYRDGENMELYADITKAKKLLNWQPQISLEEGLKKTIDSIRDFSDAG